jgi:hypothetical protein
MRHLVEVFFFGRHAPGLSRIRAKATTIESRLSDLYCTAASKLCGAPKGFFDEGKCRQMAQ